MTPFIFIGKEVERKAQEGEDICISLPLARSELPNTGLICNGDESVVEHAYYRSAPALRKLPSAWSQQENPMAARHLLLWTGLRRHQAR
jgi:hypothetical protein